MNISKVRKPILSGLIGLATLAPCKAQKAVQFVSETGITGVINKETSLYSGMNFIFDKGKNSTVAFVGGIVDKKVSLLSMAINNYAWNKNISSWGRLTSVIAKNQNTLRIDAAPIKVNAKSGNFSFSAIPAYSLYQDFRTGATTQGITPTVKASYSISPRVTIDAEAKYPSEPSKNLFNTRFGKFKDNISYYIAVLINLGGKK